VFQPEGRLDPTGLRGRPLTAIVPTASPVDAQFGPFYRTDQVARLLDAHPRGLLDPATSARARLRKPAQPTQGAQRQGQYCGVPA
jgi:hypothetical protein